MHGSICCQGLSQDLETGCTELESAKMLGKSQYTKSTTINTHVFAYQNKVKYPYAISWELYGGVKTLFYA